MNASTKFVLLAAAGMIALWAIDIVGRDSALGTQSFISKAQAEVGRPLTPVSVAGAARRTVRRCAAGVYDC
jgi:hypothetical protein